MDYSLDTIDLHMHSTVSDGTDTPAELLDRVKDAGITIFSLTDHDAIEGCRIIAGRVRDRGLRFIAGVEFSCRDELGKYHILGYGYDPDKAPIQNVVQMGHDIRMNKLSMRLEQLKAQFGFGFEQEDVDALYALDNPGKPHIANLMVRYGYAPNKEMAIDAYLDKLKVRRQNVAPDVAIQAILESGGIPVLAHPPYGSGNEIILGTDLSDRVIRLMDYGLKGLETFYSGYTPVMVAEVASLAKKHGLYMTAGSDYHGSNKLVELGDTGFDDKKEISEALSGFLDRCL